MVCKGIPTPHFKIIPPIPKIPPLLKIAHSPPYWQIGHRKFSLLTEMTVEITVGHPTCPTNLAQRLTEKRFFLLNVRTMPVENLCC